MSITEFVRSDFADAKHPTKLDVIFSNAALHWVHDHTQVFQHFWEMLNCDKTMRTLKENRDYILLITFLLISQIYRDRLFRKG